MYTLNLVDKSSSDIDFKINEYPDGQKDIIVKYNINNPVIIKSRFNNLNDLGIILSATAALKRLKVKEIHLYIPYILGGRSDRKFVQGGSSYLTDVIAPIINAQEYESVTVYDAHSDVAEAVIKNMINISNIHLVRFALDDLRITKSYHLVSPDAGALKKIWKVAEQINYKDGDDIIICSKHRDLASGKITHTSVPLPENPHYDLFIIDDICDGGRTFIEIAKVIKEKFPKSRLYLIVTHGIFSAGVIELMEYFEKVYCTNSIRDFLNNEFIIQQNIF